MGVDDLETKKIIIRTNSERESPSLVLRRPQVATRRQDVNPEDEHEALRLLVCLPVSIFTYDSRCDFQTFLFSVIISMKETFKNIFSWG